MDDEQFTAWISKYALSSGVQRMLVDRSKHFPDMVNDAANRIRTFHGEGRDWHRTEAAAIERAEQMRVERIKSLKKQIAKLENLRFTPEGL